MMFWKKEGNLGRFWNSCKAARELREIGYDKVIMKQMQNIFHLLQYLFLNILEMLQFWLNLINNINF